MESNTASFTLGGVFFEIIDDVVEVKRNIKLTALPTDLVTGLAALSYSVPPDQRGPFLDALSPFQIASKIWCTALVTAYEENIMRSQNRALAWDTILYFGSWFGQQHAFVKRSINGGEVTRAILVDVDPVASRVSRDLVQLDPYRSGAISTIVKDVHEFVDTMDAESFGRTLVVWNGIEHFRPEEIIRTLKSLEHCAVLMQSTSMHGDDHGNIHTSVNDLLDLVTAAERDEEDGFSTEYEGTLSCEYGERFMVLSVPDR
jgi:hypothetical protein